MLFCCGTTWSVAATFDNLWKQVRNLERRDLPKSAYKVVLDIEAKAKAEQHKGQQMAALLYGCKLRQVIVPDSFYTDMLKLEHLKRQTSDEVQRAVLASVLGELYETGSRYNRNNSDYIGAHPDSLREWSYAQFMQASEENFRLSMKNPAVLADAKAADYVPFIEKGKDAEYFDGDLLNVIGTRGLFGNGRFGEDDKEYRADVYGAMLEVYRHRGNREAELLLMLDSINRAGNIVGLRAYHTDPEDLLGQEEILSSEPYYTYRRMLSSFSDLPLAAEIYLSMLKLDVSPQLKIKWIDEGWARYKDYPRAKDLLNWKASLEAPQMSMLLKHEVNPDKPYEAVVRHRNISGMDLSWYFIPQGKPDRKRREEYHKNEWAFVRKYGRLQKTERLTWKKRLPHELVEDSFQLSFPGVGYYILVGKPDGVKTPQPEQIYGMCSTRLTVVGGFLPDSTCLITVVNDVTGAPVPSAVVEWYEGDDVLHTARTDAEGKARWHSEYFWEKSRNRYDMNVKARVGNDRYASAWNARGMVAFRKGEPVNLLERLYTDRSIYRPGQTVYVGGLCTDEWKGDEKAVTGRKVNLRLCDPNGKTVAEQVVESDEMGTVSATFTLPAIGLTGRYFVLSDKGRVYFTVEEYKRPTFEVRLDEVSGLSQLGDTLLLTGVAVNYNGVPLRQARVSAITSTMYGPYRTRRGNEKQPLDTVLTDSNGRFTLSVPVYKADEGPVWWGTRQQVEVSVMAASGETQTVHTSFPVVKEKINLYIESDITRYWDREKLPSLKAKVHTSAGVAYKDSVAITADIFKYEEHKRTEKVLSGIRLPVNRSIRIPEVAALPSGDYEIVAQAVTENDTAACHFGFKLFGMSDSRPAKGDKLWFYCVNDSVSTDRPGHLKVGSPEDSVSLYYMLFCEDKVMEEKLYTISDTILDFTYPEIPEGADGMQAVFYMMRDGRYYGRTQQIVRKRPDHNLRLLWTSFRDRLQPGSEETWQLRVTLPDGRPAPAQLMATLYDASLDGIRPHAWMLHRYFRLSLPYVEISPTFYSGSTYLSYNPSIKSYSLKPLEFDRFNSSMLAWGGNRTVEEVLMIRNDCAMVGAGQANTSAVARGGKRSYKSALAASDMQIAEDEVVATEEAAPEAVSAGNAAPEEEAVSPAVVAVRENLNETAFFYPRLMADTTGVVTMAFTLPESLTTWRFMALAHTKDMMTGMLTDEVVAAKEVMAQLNLPRFVRRGDRALLSATLFNLTENSLKGKATMEVFDPATGKTLWRKTEKLMLEAENDTVVSFVFEPDGSVSLPACRILLEADGHTDGEQRYLPVLEDKEWLTQTLPFTVSHKGDTVIRLDGLFQDNHPEAEHRRLTLEYTANPLWYAVQALPSVLNPRTEDVLSLGAAYYASTLSSALAAQYPQVKTAVEAWQREAGKELKSPLSAQEELVGIVLEETPWVADAESQTRQMTSLQQLFDANRQADLRRQFAASLGKLQRGDGSFGWFGGMNGNAWLTRGVARLLLRSGAGAKEDEVLAQSVDVKKMMNYLMGQAHKEIERDRESLRKHKTYAFGGSYWLDYLYLASLSNVAWFDAGVRKDLGYMQGRLLDCVNRRNAGGESRMKGDADRLSLTETAQAVLVLRYMGKPDLAAGLVRSIREHLVDTPEGLHIEYPSNGWVGSGRKIAIHTLLMEALAKEGTVSREEQDGLCRWLLSQKRLQAWNTSASSMDAVYALLQGQKEDLTLHTQDEICLESTKGKEWAVLHTSDSKLAGLGTVTATVEGRELSSGAGRVEVKKAEDEPSAWGAVYAQFRLPMAEVESSASGMRVRCELSAVSLQVGDRVTLRYIITADRDYEYVCLKAGRAACLEPADAFSGYKYDNGLGYYKEVKDASTNYFFERLPKGTYVVEEECYVERSGRYSLGAPRLNGVYAPEFSAYGAAQMLEVRP